MNRIAEAVGGLRRDEDRVSEAFVPRRSWYAEPFRPQSTRLHPSRPLPNQQKKNKAEKLV